MKAIKNVRNKKKHNYYNKFVRIEDETSSVPQILFYLLT